MECSRGWGWDGVGKRAAHGLRCLFYIAVGSCSLDSIKTKFIIALSAALKDREGRY